MKKITLGISGMTCVACSNAITKHLSKQNGILSANVNLVMANATIEYDEQVLNIKQIENFIKQSGYKSTGIYKFNSEAKKIKTNKILLIIFGVLTAVLLYISMGAMINLPIPSFLNMHSASLSYAITLLVLTIPFLFYGLDIFVSGIKALFKLHPNMNSLVCLGVLASFGYSIFSFVMVCRGAHAYVNSLYFESCAVIVYFIKLGRFIDGLSKNKTTQAIKELVQITPNQAIIKQNGGEKLVSIDEIKQGDIVICRAGEKIAVDGKIVLGNAHLDESFITGESKPNSKQVGDNVIAGSYNFDGYIEYVAERIGKNSTISEIVNLVVEASNTKMPIAKVADKVSAVFVPSIIAVAIISFVAYLIAGFGFNTALNTFVTVLVVACPCSLGLATPLAIVVSVGLSAKNGILVKKSESLELANKAKAVVFDKTGTLTLGKLKIAKILKFNKLTERQILTYACSMESLSSHPIANAFKERAQEQKLKLLKVENFKTLNGLGVVGKIKNMQVAMGNAKLLAKLKIKNEYTEQEKQLSSLGNSIVYLAIDGQVGALFGVSDLLKANAKQLILNLNKQHIETFMLTGDNVNTATIFAKQLGIKRVFAGVMPKEKANIIKQLKQENKIVIMCGDGINDSPALASADVGLSVSNGTEIAMNSADVILMKDDLLKILNFLTISKKTIVNVKQNLFWAFFYNLLMVPIAVGVFRGVGLVINPMIAGLAMVLSSLTVVLNALRLKFIKLNKKENKNV